MDLVNDLKYELIRISNNQGVKLPKTHKAHEVLLSFLTLQQKYIAQKNRLTLTSKQLEQEKLKHPKEREINAIIEIASNGGNLNYFQSKRLTQASFFDHLQNQWNIYHFHLSLEKDKKSKFAKQVNSLIFAYITDSHIVFLGTDIHEYGIFGDDKWIRILHKEFPYLISKYLDTEILSLTPKLTSREKQNLWDNGVITGMTEIDGVVYHNPGIGSATSGHSTLIVKQSVEIQRWLKNIEKQALSYSNELCKTLSIENLNSLKIKVQSSKIVLIETINNRKVLIFPEVFDERTLIMKR